ncbi:hypothetical protein GCM10010401_07200 [Rarobacter faecitabidus]|uniref:Uncharacterized protein n=1 Tax=Rarobacter faecitabidus TaxID=13243 RepID=A0A542Z861_RARFA|nr:hypothetical protein [Rarobacter faecitabidus]TQL56525.1 hypothetical protein FB461_2411 [Rarobacter faecitabidus]
MNPDCAQGKHAACTGDAWNEIADELTACDCDCHQDRPDLPQNRPENATGGAERASGGSDEQGGLKSDSAGSAVGRLDEIRAREQAATGGPWAFHADSGAPLDADAVDAADGTEVCSYLLPANAEFIAHAREDIPRLLAAVDAVLELHKATRYGDMVGDLKHALTHDVLVCPICEDGTGGYETYPCPTVRAITEAVGS